MVGNWKRYTADTDSAGMVLQAKANMSMSLAQLAAVFCWLSAVTLGVATYLTVQGSWPIMVFAILHLAVVGFALRLAWRNNWRLLQITIDHEQVTIRFNHVGSIWETSMTTAWTRVDYSPGRPPVVENQLRLRCQGTSIRLGEFLNCQERELLAQRLAEGLRKYSLLQTPIDTAKTVSAAQQQT